MIKLHFRLIFVPDKGLFELTFGNEQWYLKPDEIKEIIGNAKKELVDATDAMVSYELKTPNLTIVLNGVTSRDTYTQMVSYLDKVWTSFAQSRYYKGS